MWDWNFQDPASVYAYSLMYVHHQVMWYMIIILSVVYWSFYRILRQYNWYSHNKQMGTLYTIFYANPIFIKIETWVMTIIFLLSSKLLNSSLAIMKFLAKSFPTLNSELVGLLSVWYIIDNKINTQNSKNIVENLILQKYQYYNYHAIANNAYALGGDKEFLQVQNFRDNILLEYIWAIFPSLVIFLILIPSLYLLYSMEENMNPRFNIKVIGHQWFWSYEFDSYDLSFEFDSNLVIEDDLTEGAKRLLEVDNRLYLPVNVPLRLLITSSDVLHSWAVPELGIKVDAVPGRLNDAITLIRRPGVFYGQCSELCGVGHGFMPIVVEACSYKQWLQKISEQ